MKLVCLVLFLLLSPTPGYLAPPGDPLPLRDTATPGHAAPPEGTAPPGDAALPISPSLEGTVPPGDVETPGHAGGGNGEAVMTGLEGGGSRDVREKLHTNVKQGKPTICCILEIFHVRENWWIPVVLAFHVHCN